MSVVSCLVAFLYICSFMITNAEIRQIRSLREKKFRDELGLFVVEGEKMVQEALMSNFEVVRVWRMDEIGENAMSRISQFSSPSPVLAVVSKPKPAGFVLERSLCLALDSVRDPGNLGTIIRIADWFGVKTVFLSEDCADVYNQKVIQSSMGSIFRVKVVHSDIVDICRRFKAAGMPVYGTLLDGENIYTRELEADGLVVMGNESNGISEAVRAEVSSALLIPSFCDSRAESLNVAAATAITLSELRRR